MQYLLQQLRLFLLALETYTRLTAPSWVHASTHSTVVAPSSVVATLRHSSLRYYPLVGLLIGVFCSLFMIVPAHWFPPTILVLFVLAAAVLVTGAKAESAFAKVCDGLNLPGTPAQTLAQLNASDPQLRAFGVTALVLLLLFKFSLLAYQSSTWIVIALLCGPAFSRLVALLLALVLRDLGGGLRIGLVDLLFALIAGTLPLLLVLGNRASMPLLPGPLLLGAGFALTAGLLMGLWFQRRIGGLTEDCLHAVQQIAEVMLYLGLLVSPH